MHYVQDPEVESQSGCKSGSRGCEGAGNRGPACLCCSLQPRKPHLATHHGSARARRYQLGWLCAGGSSKPGQVLTSHPLVFCLWQVTHARRYELAFRMYICMSVYLRPNAIDGPGRPQILLPFRLSFMAELGLQCITSNQLVQIVPKILCQGLPESFLSLQHGGTSHLSHAHAWLASWRSSR